MDSLTVRENIMLPKILDKGTAKDCIQKAEESAEQFGIRHLLDKKPYELSGGEKQRVAICRALINDPELILADEPTGNLDSKSGDVVISTMTEINKELGKTIVMVTHDPKMASYCSRLILLKDGVILEDLKKEGDQEVLPEDPGEDERIVEKIGGCRQTVVNGLPIFLNCSCISSGCSLKWALICNISGVLSK